MTFSKIALAATLLIITSVPPASAGDAQARWDIATVNCSGRRIRRSLQQLSLHAEPKWQRNRFGC
jgi:hypothetical protein